MGTQRQSDETVIGGLCEVFREYGYEGASLTLISEATGLKRSSLYHRFPGGKEEMAVAVLEHASRRLGEYVFAPLSEKGDLAARVKKMGKRLVEFYDGGRKACLLDTLTVAERPSQRVTECARQAYEGWISVFASVAKEAGFGPAASRRRAEAAVIQLEGALVVARVQNKPGVFARVVADLGAILIG